MAARFYLEQYQRHRRRGLASYRQGDVAEARYQFLRAAEFLFKLARESDGRIRDGRVAAARKLVTLSKQLRERKPKPAEAAPAETPAAPKPADKPSITFDDIAGLDDVKEQIRLKMIDPVLHPAQARTYRIRSGGGILLYGPPGTGKTMIARAVAAELDAPFYAIAPSDVLTKWVGESEKNVKQLFQTARASPSSVIFIDEVEALTPKRREMQEGGVMQRVVPQILAELDGFDRREGQALLFIGATNEPWSIDGAILRPGRLDERIYVGLPDAAARRRILELNLAGVPRAGDVDLGALAARLDGYSGADVAYLCRKVCERAFRRAVTGAGEEPIAARAFDEVLGWLRPSVGPAELKRFEMFRKGGA
jgi:transitional endoplasmic reticulum ATPase